LDRVAVVDLDFDVPQDKSSKGTSRHTNFRIVFSIKKNILGIDRLPGRNGNALEAAGYGGKLRLESTKNSFTQNKTVFA